MVRNITDAATRRAYRADVADFALCGDRQAGGVPDRDPAARHRLTGAAVYASVVMHDASAAGVDPAAVNVHELRTTAVTNALDHPADIARVQAWCGHRSIATTKRYDRRHGRPEDSPTFKVAYL